MQSYLITATKPSRIKADTVFWPLFTALLLFSPLSAFAAGAAHAEAHDVSLGYIIVKLLPYWINLLIFAAVLFLAIRKPFKAFWQQRRTAISNGIEASRVELQEVTKAWEEIKQRVATIDSQQAQLELAILEEAKAEAAQIIKEAQERVGMIGQLADFAIRSEEKATAGRLRSDLIDSVVDLATEKIKKSLSPEMDRNIQTAVLTQAKGL